MLVAGHCVAAQAAIRLTSLMPGRALGAGSGRCVLALASKVQYRYRREEANERVRNRHR
jgi:hypothetical protein